MKVLRRSLRIDGLHVDRLLARLQSEGFTLYNIKTLSTSSLEADCAYDGFDALRTLIEKRGFSVTELPPRGMSRRILHIQSRYTLLLSAVFLLVLLSYSLQFIWHVEIAGAGIYAGEVRSYLRDANIGVGTHRSAVDLDVLCNDLTWRLPQIAWVRASHKGLSLCIDITQGTPRPVIENQGANGHLLAACDGVVQSVSVYAGTAAVKAGDTVRAGDILIYGHERSGNDALVPVRARGKVIARTFVSASADISTDSYQSSRTGKTAQLYMICSPFGQFSLTKEPAYLTSERESQRISLSGLWLPVWLERQTVHEIALTSQPADEASLRAEAARLAMQKLLLICGGKDEIIDKWLDYSMIEGGNIRATITAEVWADIALFSPATPDEEI